MNEPHETADEERLVDAIFADDTLKGAIIELAEPIAAFVNGQVARAADGLRSQVAEALPYGDFVDLCASLDAAVAGQGGSTLAGAVWSRVHTAVRRAAPRLGLGRIGFDPLNDRHIVAVGQIVRLAVQVHLRGGALVLLARELAGARGEVDAADLVRRALGLRSGVDLGNLHRAAGRWRGPAFAQDVDAHVGGAGRPSASARAAAGGRDGDAFGAALSLAWQGMADRKNARPAWDAIAAARSEARFRATSRRSPEHSRTDEKRDQVVGLVVDQAVVTARPRVASALEELEAEEEAARRAVLLARATRAVGELPDSERRAFEARRDGASWEQVGQLLGGITDKAAKAKLEKITRKLREASG